MRSGAPGSRLPHRDVRSTSQRPPQMSNQLHDHEVAESLRVAEYLPGTWRVDIDGNHSGTGWLHFTANGLAVQLTIYDSEPQRRIAQRFWYTIESADTLRFRPRLDQEGWTRSYLRQDDSSFVLGAGDRLFPCTRLSADDYPEWFDEALADQLTQFMES
jgi:hypothetical protein